MRLHYVALVTLQVNVRKKGSRTMSPPEGFCAIVKGFLIEQSGKQQTAYFSRSLIQID